MWAGNVPSDCTHDELWRFFNSTPSSSSPDEPSESEAAVESPFSEQPSSGVHGGVSSIFLISRSNCAFVNFVSQEHLLAAIALFNGQQLRPGDLRCPRLVCRVRGREDDLKAGVGGQRGAGIHVRWIKERKDATRAHVAQAQGQASRGGDSSSEHLTTPSSSPGASIPTFASLSISSDDEGATSRGARVRRQDPHSSSSGSYASTNSSMLAQYFPKRYFILKSLTQVSSVFFRRLVSTA